MQNSAEAKYLIHARIEANGVVEKPDVVGAIFGQTEGLVGENSDLRELQKGGKVGRIKVNIKSKNGKSEGKVLIPSSLNKVETAVLAASLETIDRIGPCKAEITTTDVEDIRESKRDRIVDRAKEILSDIFEEGDIEDNEITKTVRRSFGDSRISNYRGLSAGPNVASSDAVLLVEGRSDVLNLLDFGIKNAVAIDGTDIPDEIEELSKEKTITAFLDDDRGGDLILKEVMQRVNIDYIARAPDGNQVEDLNHKQILEALRSKEPAGKYKGKKTLKKSSSVKRKPKNKKSKSKILQKAKRGVKEKYMSSKSNKSSKARKKSTDTSRNESNQDLGDKKSSTESKLTQSSDKDPKKFQDSRTYSGMLEELKGTLKALLLSSEDQIIKEIAVRELTNELKNIDKNIHCVVFDGVVTQRLLDVCVDEGVKRLVGIKYGNVVRKPTDVDVIVENNF